MNCRQSRRLFSRHLDERLDEEERRELDVHLAGCSRCRTELDRWDGTSRALRAVGPAPVPEQLAERSWRAVLAAIAAQAAPSSFEERFVWAARRAAAVAVLAAALVWGGLLWRDPQPRDTAAELALPPDATEMAMTLWVGDPGPEVALDE